MKKISYNNKTTDELNADLKGLRMAVQAAVTKSRSGKNSKDYVVARKNIARVLTALNSPTNSTEVKK